MAERQETLSGTRASSRREDPTGFKPLCLIPALNVTVLHLSAPHPPLSALSRTPSQGPYIRHILAKTVIKTVTFLTNDGINLRHPNEEKEAETRLKPRLKPITQRYTRYTPRGIPRTHPEVHPVVHTHHGTPPWYTPTLVHPGYTHHGTPWLYTHHGTSWSIPTMEYLLVYTHHGIPGMYTLVYTPCTSLGIHRPPAVRSTDVSVRHRQSVHVPGLKTGESHG